jgi:uncharacterized protein (TIGR00730 family)
VGNSLVIAGLYPGGGNGANDAGDAAPANRHKAAMITSLLVFCGSRSGHDPAHAALAAALGQLLARRGISLVYGGGGVGLMGIMARASLAAGGHVIGVIPRALMTAEIAQTGLAEMHVVDSLHERKALMHGLADAILAIPGSIGTLDELFESMTWRELGIHDKPIWLLGDNGYWAPLLALLGHLATEGFAPPDLDRLALALPDLAALEDRLAATNVALPASHS